MASIQGWGRETWGSVVRGVNTAAIDAYRSKCYSYCQVLDTPSSCLLINFSVVTGLGINDCYGRRQLPLQELL